MIFIYAVPAFVVILIIVWSRVISPDMFDWYVVKCGTILALALSVLALFSLFNGEMTQTQVNYFPMLILFTFAGSYLFAWVVYLAFAFLIVGLGKISEKIPRDNVHVGHGYNNAKKWVDNNYPVAVKTTAIELIDEAKNIYKIEEG